ncbi:hypothetical protein [Chitinophaga ginsengisoli]|uniref:Uncharacterized protein n=1 Tax=Chitinophaga ginsengisoli TaxID=363837 RepID=A0A2P8GI11_9BACT|nr:hypothetical protein [Chitinophaga ginsengisoli]PSL33601.1 hypothetical protein CLV42_103584 [Chitinophaga ginsengisoli]
MRKGLPIFILTACILSAFSCSAQALQPLDVAKAIFDPKTAPDFVSQHSTGDYSGHPNGLDMPATTNTSFLLIQQTDSKAVIAMNTRDSNGKVTDKYLFFTQDSSRWKMYAMATPTLARLHEHRKQEMEAISSAQLDSLITIYQHQEYPPFKSKEEFSFILNSLRLKLAPDDSLIAHFQRHKAAFNQLLKEVNKTSKSPETETPTLVDTRTPTYSPLLISNVTTGGFLPKECIDFHIMNDQVGYLYTSHKKYLPELRPDKVIMLRPLGGGWYLYKVNIYL